MEINLFKNGLCKKLLTLFSFFIFLSSFAQSFLIDFPAFSTAPTKNPQDITVCNGTSKLQVHMVANATASSSASVTIQLGTGIDYVPGSVAMISSVGGLTILEDGGTANAPKFKILNSSGGITSSNEIIFTINRNAKCAARTAVLGGTIFSDTVSGTIPGSTVTTQASGVYSVSYAVVNFTQPVAQNNAVLNQSYNRTFSLVNSGIGNVSTVYFSLNNSGLKTNTLTLMGGSGSAGTPVVLTPTSTVGNISYYAITAANLSGGNLDNGEVLNFTENYKVIACNGVTNYSVGWGCDATPANWCDTKTGSGSVTMASGTPNIGLTWQKEVAGNFCTGETWSYTYTNNGSQNTPNAGTAFDIVAILGTQSWQTPNLVSANDANVTLENFRINGVPVTATRVGAFGNGYYLDLSQLTVNPYSIGGLVDANGDGKFNDLPVGATIKIEYDLKWKSTAPIFNVCNTSIIDVVPNARINYTNQCGTALNSYNTTPISTSRYVLAQSRTRSANGPTDVTGGNAFQVQFNLNTNEATFPQVSANDYVLRLSFDLPAGVHLNTTTAGYTLNSGTSVPVTAVQNGNTVVVEYPYTNAGFQVNSFNLEFIADCPAPNPNFTIPYKFEAFASSCPEMKVQLGCGIYGSVAVHCPCNTAQGGIATEPAIGKRTTLGYTNGNLTTHVTESSIPARSLKRLLPGDEAEITLKGTQLPPVTYDNLNVNLTFGKKSATEPYLNILSGTVKVTKVSTGAVYNINLPTPVSTSTATSETYKYNLASQLPVGITFEPGDSYELKVKVKYTGVATPGNVETLVPGTFLYFYNLDGAGTEVTCGGSAVELYLIPITQTGLQIFPQTTLGSGCNGGVVQAGYRQTLPTEVDPFPGEFRPSVYVDELTIVLPPGFTFDQSRATTIGPTGNWMTYNNGSGTGNQLLTAPIVNGNIVKYVNDGTWKLGDQVNSSTNLIQFYIPIAATCAATTGTNYFPAIGSEIKVRPNYYAYANHPIPPAIPDATYLQETTAATFGFVNRDRDYNGKPGIAISSQSGILQASKPIESVDVRVTSTGQTAANNVWLSVLNNPNITIVDIIDLSTNASILATGQTYSAGTWYKAAATLASAATRDFRINFKYTSCTPDKITINAGWDCSGYPTSPDTYPCTPSTVDVNFNPIPGQIQVQSVSQPSSPIAGLCAPLNYEFKINSAGGGNLKEVKFAINQIQGMTVTNSSIQVEYPFGAGNWANVSSTVSGNQIILDLTTHPAFPTNGLPGSLNDGGVAANRQMGIRFAITTDCTFVSNSNFTVTPHAKNSCGSNATGSGSNAATNSVTIAGASATYTLSTVVNPSTTLGSCGSAITLPVEQTIAALSPTGSTGTVRVDLPLGYDFAATPITCSGAFCPTVQGVYTDATTNTRYLILNIPSGMNSGDKMSYNVNIIEAQLQIACGAHQIKITGFDKAGSISCPSAPGGMCTDVTILTGTYEFDFTINKPVYTISSVNGSLSGTTFSGSVTLNNTTAFATSGNININFYCRDAAGNPTTTLFGTATISAVAANSSSTQTYSFTPNAGASCATGMYYAVIEQSNNCICSSSNGLNVLTSCYKPGILTGTTSPTNHGITSLGRAGATNGNWPMVRNGAWTVLEAKTKGFVVNRVAFNTTGNPVGIATANFVEGMMVYDTTNNCLKIYNGTIWSCYTTPACPD